MKRSHEKHTSQQQLHMLQSKVMEVTQRIQPVQDQACILFTDIENQGAELEQVVLSAEQPLEGLVNNAMIQEFTEQEATAKQQVKAARGIQGRLGQIRVTRDESQVSVGGMLALDQVLEVSWSC
jgi:uncharacterized protein YggU (UPF0235/DUF167 family)